MSQTRVEGTIRKALSGFYYVQTEQTLVTCRARGKFRYQKVTPLVGDRVAIALQPDGSGSLVEILPRRNAFQRPAVANLLGPLWPTSTSWSSSPPGRSR